MVKKIKRITKRPKVVQGGSNQWLVPFDENGQAAIYIHKHGDGDDHSSCGPVVMCCERAAQPYKNHAPDLHGSVHTYRQQDGRHLCTWFDSGVQAMYFVLCDHDDPNGGYQFGLPAADARDLLEGRTPHSQYRLPGRHFA